MAVSKDSNSSSTENDHGIYHDIFSQYKNRPMTLVAVGKTGKGKSSTLNSLLNILKQKGTDDVDEDFFKTSEGPDSVTRNVHHCIFTPRGFPKLRLVDTVGLFDTKLTYNRKKELTLMKMSSVDEVHRLVLQQFLTVMEICKERIDAFLFVMNVRDRASMEELRTIDIIFRYLGWKLLDYVIFVFTGKDQARESSFQGWKEHVFSYLDTLGYERRRIQDRFLFFDNTNPTKAQALELLNTVCFVNDFNKGRPYTLVAFDEAQKQLEEEKKQIREQLEGKLKEKIDAEVKPIQERYEADKFKLQSAIDQKTVEMNQLRNGQVAEKQQLLAQIQGLEKKQQKEKDEMEAKVKREVDRLDWKKQEAYEAERAQMTNTIKSLVEEMSQTRADMARQIREAQNNKKENECTVM